MTAKRNFLPELIGITARKKKVQTKRMKILYLDCGMGAAGDMLSASLLELLPDKEAFIEKLNNLKIPGVRFEALSVVKNGISGTRMKVTVNGVEEGAAYEHTHGHEHTHDHEHAHGHEHTHDHEHAHEHEHQHAAHHHYGMHDIEHLVSHLDVPETVKKDILGVYRMIADAESRVHGQSVTQIHFHEVGSMDAVADVTAVCLLMAELNPDQVMASPVCTGSGTVKCAHGILPVPAPATALLLEGIPVFSGQIKTELCTPTGAALLKYFVQRFAAMPPLTVEKIGYGMGSKEFEQVNCVRALLGKEANFAGCACEKEKDGQKESGTLAYAVEGCTDEVVELSCNLDDMTAEEISFAVQKLFEGGAKDVWTSPIVMKKGRQGTLLSVLCAPFAKAEMVQLLFAHTTTIGIRETLCKRCILERREETADTPYGPVRKKVSKGWGVEKEKYEYDDLAKIACNTGLSLAEVRKTLSEA